MYSPAHFAEHRPEVLHRLIREQPFGLLVTQSVSSGMLVADGVPFILDDDPAGGPGVLRTHVARANPLWREARTDLDSLVVFQGAQAYVSPAWYPGKAEHGKVVPTWNYVMVQACGRLRAIDDAAWLHAFVSRLTDRHEATREVPWAVSDAPAPYIEQMTKAIVGIEIVLSSIEGKWKVTQNRSAADREGVARGLVAERGADDVASAERAAMAAEVRAPGGTG